MTVSTAPWGTELLTAALVLADGTVILGRGLGATGRAVAEVCFNTALTGYQEILTDPSYAGQIITFTFPHIGNIGVNDEDIEDLNPARRAGAVGAVFKADVTNPSNYRAAEHLDSRPLLEEPFHDDHRHRRVVLADDLTISFSNFSSRGDVLIAIDDIPRQAH